MCNGECDKLDSLEANFWIAGEDTMSKVIRLRFVWQVLGDAA